MRPRLTISGTMFSSTGSHSGSSAADHSALPVHTSNDNAAGHGARSASAPLGPPTNVQVKDRRGRSKDRHNLTSPGIDAFVNSPSPGLPALVTGAPSVHHSSFNKLAQATSFKLQFQMAKNDSQLLATDLIAVRTQRRKSRSTSYLGPIYTRFRGVSDAQRSAIGGSRAGSRAPSIAPSEHDNSRRISLSTLPDGHFTIIGPSALFNTDAPILRNFGARKFRGNGPIIIPCGPLYTYDNSVLHAYSDFD